MNYEELIAHLESGQKLHDLDWDDHEYICYSREKNAVVNESGEEVNAVVLVFSREFVLYENRKL